MTQGKLEALLPLEWEDSDYWGKTSVCRRFSIRGQTINGETEYVLWARSDDGRVIPKHLGAFKTFEEAEVAANERKYGDKPKRDKIFDWKSDAEDWR